MNFHSRRVVVISICRISVPIMLLLAVLSAFAQPTPVHFEDILSKRFSTDAAWTLEKFCPVSSNLVARRVLHSYGSMYSAHESISLPSGCIQGGEGEVIKYQKSLKTHTLEIDGVKIELQESAGTSLRAALDEAAAKGLRITPLDGAIAGRRSYGDTLMLWNSRYFPALEYWIKRGRLTETDRDSIARLDLLRKVERVLEWEKQGIYFSTNRTRSIFSSTAPPGTSQHLALMALDVVESWSPEVRAILNRHGWYQTIVDDAPHFTYLGFPEAELPGRGLRAVLKGGVMYWVPKMRDSTPR